MWATSGRIDCKYGGQTACLGHRSGASQGGHCNWELLANDPHGGPDRRFSLSCAIALDMESATIAAKGFRFHVPYRTLL